MGFGVKNVIKMKLKTNTSLLVLYVCYWPGLEDRSSGPGIIVSRSLSRGEFASLSSKHGFFTIAKSRIGKKKVSRHIINCDDDVYDFARCGSASFVLL